MPATPDEHGHACHGRHDDTTPRSTRAPRRRHCRPRHARGPRRAWRARRPRGDVPQQVLDLPGPDDPGPGRTPGCCGSGSASSRRTSRRPKLVAVRDRHRDLRLRRHRVPPISAWAEIRPASPGMMTLVAVGITAACGVQHGDHVRVEGEGFYWELATLVDVMLLGHWIEMGSIIRPPARSRSWPSSSPTPPSALRDGGTEDGSRLRARGRRRGPGPARRARARRRRGRRGRIPPDESMLTGESRPVGRTRRRAGRRDGERRGRPAGPRHPHRRRHGAGRDHAPGRARPRPRSRAAQALADRVAGWLAYIAIGAGHPSRWACGSHSEPETASFVVERAVTVVVIACPHALGLAVPLVIAISTSLAARSGLLVRDRMALEYARARRHRRLRQDRDPDARRDGRGRVSPSRRSERRTRPWPWQRRRRPARSTPSAGPRPCRRRAVIEAGRADAFEALAGRGVRARVGGREVHVGGPSLLESLRVEVPAELGEAGLAMGVRGQERRVPG